MRRLITLFAALGLSLGALAADWPDKPIRVIVPASPGGAADVLARLVSRGIAKGLGTTMYIENRTGAAGIIGMQALAKSPADGYTIGLVFAGAMAINPSFYKGLPYDATKDFDPVALVAISPLVLVTSPKSGIQSMGDLVDKARKQPGKFSFGSTGIGSTQHLSVELLKGSYDLDMLHVPYKGSGASMIDLQGGLITLVSDNALSVIPFIQAGQIVPLAVEGSQRLESLPNVPTTVELGLPKFQAAGWYGVVAPAGTPPKVVQKLSDAIEALLKRPDFQREMQRQGMQPQPGSPEDFKAFIAADQDKWAGVMRVAKVPLQDLR